MEESVPEIRCAEVLGGNLRVDEGLRLPDLDVWLFSEPHGGGEEGGDVVLVSVCERGMVSKAYLADVAGHGSAVAPFARAVRVLVRDHLNDMDHAAFLKALNAAAEAGALPGLFATMAAVSFVRPRGRLVYAYAGHPHLLLRTGAADAFVSLEPGYCPVPGTLLDLALGVVPGTEYRQSAVPFSPGDMAVLYSDGLTEAPLPGGGRPDVEGLLSVANACSTASARAFREDLLRGFREELGVTEFSDDASLVVVKRAG